MIHRDVRILLIGVGNLGRRFARLIRERARPLEDRYGMRVRLVGAVDRGGAAIDPTGLDGGRLADLKEAGRSVSAATGVGRPGMTGLEAIDAVDADVLCEASPVNLATGAEPGLSHVRAGLSRGLHVITPNKGPIVLAYRELVERARAHHVALRFDGTVAGGLPALWIGERDLRGAEIDRIEAVPNLTTGFVLDRLSEGASWDEATAAARAEGVLEADPAWDLDGWDAAAKLVILSLCVLGLDARLENVARRGIGPRMGAWARRERRAGRSVRLLATAERVEGGGYGLSVAPKALPAEHPLGRLGPKSMGVVYWTDIYGTIAATIDEPSPVPSAATMLRDLLAIYDR